MAELFAKTAAIRETAERSRLGLGRYPGTPETTRHVAYEMCDVVVSLTQAIEMLAREVAVQP